LGVEGGREFSNPIPSISVAAPAVSAAEPGVLAARARTPHGRSPLLFPQAASRPTYWTVFDAASKRDGAGAAGSHGDIATLTLRRSPHALDSARSQNRCGERRARRRGLRRARVRRRSERRYGARRAWLCPPLTPGERGGVEREMDRGGGDCSRRRQRRTGTKRRGSTSPTCRIPRVSARLVVRLKEERCAR
jgi:hypothetical protein